MSGTSLRDQLIAQGLVKPSREVSHKARNHDNKKAVEARRMEIKLPAKNVRKGAGNV
jgi:hypothetical protein